MEDRQGGGHKVGLRKESRCILSIPINKKKQHYKNLNEQPLSVLPYKNWYIPYQLPYTDSISIKRQG